MLWDNIVGQHSAKLALGAACKSGRIKHAYLFTGPSGVGKFLTALVFSASLLCEDGGCGTCDTCRRVMEKKHPDVLILEPSGKNIPVEDIRQMRLEAFKRPVEGNLKVFIMKGAERMWEEGASTLLKVLEEPPGNVVFILVTAKVDALLPTIRSRCEDIKFSNVPREELRDYLVQRKGMALERAELVAGLTQGVLGKAAQWCEDERRFSRRQKVIHVALSLKKADLNTVLGMAEELYEEVKSPLEDIASRLAAEHEELTDGSLDGDLAKKLSKDLEVASRRERIKEENKGMKEIISTLSWWYRDILVLEEYNDSGLVVNKDMLAELEKEQEAISTEGLIHCLELLEESMKAVDRNVQPQLNLESTLLGVQEVLYA